MNTDFRYKLETPRITGRRQEKTTCPACGRPKCFVRYVDTLNGCKYISDVVGKCDHQHSCGYHYKPSEYYHDKLECLRGRRITLFPDSGCYKKWQNVMQQTSGLDYNISDTLEQYPANTDLADLLLHPP